MREKLCFFAIVVINLLALTSCGGGGENGTENVSVYSVGGQVSGLNGAGLVLSSSSGDQVLVPQSAVNFSFTAPFATGAAYAVTVLTQPVGQLCSVTNGSGTVGNSNVSNIIISCAVSNTPKFAFVTNGNADSISAFTVNAATGALTPVTGSPFAAGIGPGTVAVDPTGKFAYVTNYWSNEVSAFSINASTGALTPVNGSPFTTGFAPVSVIVDPSGRFVYVSNMGAGNISAYTINANTGALTEMAGSPFGTGINAWACAPVRITIDPWGKFLYVADQTFGNIEVLRIDSHTGSLSVVTPGVAPGGSQLFTPASIAIDATGQHVYLTDIAFGNITSYTINASTGTLAEVPNSIIQVLPGDPTAVAADPSGKFVYIAHQLGNGAGSNDNVLAYAINSQTGALSQIPGSPYTTGAGSISITVDPSGKFVYVINALDNTISAYTIDTTTGSLASMAGSPYAAEAAGAGFITITK